MCKYDKIYKILYQKGDIKLSVKNELIALKGAREDLEKQLAEICSTLDKLYAQKVPLVQKAEILSTRTSSLAQTLLEKVQEELENVNQEIAQTESRQAEVKKEIAENQQNILQREDDVGLYINEQSSIMVSTFFEYMRSHLEELGVEIKKNFRIMEVTRYKDDRYNGCHVPTGDIGIYDESKETFIVSSNDFYFKNNLYTITRGQYDALVCNETEWYKAYRNQFISHLLETLEKSYTFGEFFKLTIEDSYFTLELV